MRLFNRELFAAAQGAGAPLAATNPREAVGLAGAGGPRGALGVSATGTKSIKKNSIKTVNNKL